MIDSSNKTIAKNTLLLYFRMLLTMVISLYTSRVILQILGVEDFGIYQTVGGVVGMLSFVNGALATGTSRFLTYELGTGDLLKLKKTFSTMLTAHVILAIGVFAISETIGLWFVCNKLVIPSERMGAALFAYHVSILTAMVQLTQVPYTASIISHERMGVYAYMSIVEVTLKLLIVYLLAIGNWDKLVLYATLLAFVTIGLAMYYRVYCKGHFEESHYTILIDKSIIKEVLGYSGWNLLANTSIALNNHGGVLLLNMFFSPGVVTARAVANQVNMAANQFISNFRTAANPQIVKRYAAKDFNSSKNLLLSSTKYSYFLMLFLALPIALVAEQLLSLWLGQVPPYSAVFLQLTIVCSLFQVFDTSFYTALYAKGQIRENALISPILGFISFPIVYILFKLGFSPVALAWVAVIRYALLGLVVKPVLVVQIVHYSWRDICSVFFSCLKVTLTSLPLPLFVNYIVKAQQIPVWVEIIVITVVCILSVGICSWYFGLTSEIRFKLIALLYKKLR